MGEPIIRVESLGKKYLISHQVRGARYVALRDVLAARARSALRVLRGGRALNPHTVARTEEFWALKDVSFEIEEGEILGIIGRNGAGKTTLLKILSRITEPTTGRVILNGRVASLLEVGTGFHPELTGRENIYLNGSILGMTRSEIAKKFDEIVAFADMERFLDTPVKRYSSGMHVRLAFAVAAHLEPEILIVDEVLAVGDAAFQKKCLGKMGEVAQGGRTVLFVSHNLQAISQLTHTVFVMDAGQIKFRGPTAEGVAHYAASEYAVGGLNTSYSSSRERAGNYLSRAEVITSEPGGEHIWGKQLIVHFELNIDEPRETLCFSFQIVDETDRAICYFWLLDRCDDLNQGAGSYQFCCSIPKLRLYMGRYSVKTYLADRRSHEWIEEVSGICSFEVTMRGIHRDQYDWEPGATAYIEEATWSNVQKL